METSNMMKHTNTTQEDLTYCNRMMANHFPHLEHQEGTHNNPTTIEQPIHSAQSVT